MYVCMCICPHQINFMPWLCECTCLLIWGGLLWILIAYSFILVVLWTGVLFVHDDKSETTLIKDYIIELALSLCGKPPVACIVLISEVSRYFSRSHIEKWFLILSKLFFFWAIDSLNKTTNHVDVIKCKHLPRYRPFVWGIHRSPVNSPHKGHWRRALMFSLICVWINGWENNREAGDLRRHRAHYDVIIIVYLVVNIAPGLAPWGAQPSAGTVDTISLPYIYI